MAWVCPSTVSVLPRVGSWSRYEVAVLVVVSGTLPSKTPVPLPSAGESAAAGGAPGRPATAADTASTAAASAARPRPVVCVRLALRFPCRSICCLPLGRRRGRGGASLSGRRAGAGSQHGGAARGLAGSRQENGSASPLGRRDPVIEWRRRPRESRGAPPRHYVRRQRFGVFAAVTLTAAQALSTVLYSTLLAPYRSVAAFSVAVRASWKSVVETM